MTIKELQAALATEREVRESLEESLFNLAQFARDNNKFELPMSGNALVARDEIRGLRRAIDEWKGRERQAHRLLDEMGVSAYSSGGEGDAEVEMNIFDRLRSLNSSIKKR